LGRLVTNCGVCVGKSRGDAQEKIAWSRTPDRLATKLLAEQGESAMVREVAVKALRLLSSRYYIQYQQLEILPMVRPKPLRHYSRRLCLAKKCGSY
jgi:hypothetical protein